MKQQTTSLPGVKPASVFDALLELCQQNANKLLTLDLVINRLGALVAFSKPRIAEVISGNLGMAGEAYIGGGQSMSNAERLRLRLTKSRNGLLNMTILVDDAGQVAAFSLLRDSRLEGIFLERASA